MEYVRGDPRPPAAAQGVRGARHGTAEFRTGVRIPAIAVCQALHYAYNTPHELGNPL